LHGRFFVRAGIAKACALRARTTSNVYGYKPAVQIERGFSGKPDAWPGSNQFRNNEIGLPNDRRLRADGFIIRAQATIRTDDFSVRAGFANTCCASPVFCTDTHHPCKNGVLQNAETDSLMKALTGNTGKNALHRSSSR
jgi:hypothetical protein